MDNNTEQGTEISIPAAYRAVQFRDAARSLDYEIVVHDPATDFEAWHISSSAPSTNATLSADILGGSGTFVDVGANIGLIAVPVAMTGPNVICVEPNPANILMLTLAARRNRLDNFEIYQGASSSVDGILRFAGTEAWGHISESESAFPVTALRLDTILAPILDRSDRSTSKMVLKVDVEGHEAEVLKGAIRTLTSANPYVIIESIEIEGQEDKNNTAPAKAILEDLGFSLYLVRDEVLSPTSAAELQEGHVSDYLAVAPGTGPFLENTRWQIRHLTLEERVDWVREMVEFPSASHHLHALGVLKRWCRESHPAFAASRYLLEHLRRSEDMRPHMSQIDQLIETIDRR